MKTYLSPLAAAAALVLLMGGCATRSSGPVDINLVALNDFHGNLERSKFRYTSVIDKTPHTIEAGGIDTVAAALQAWRQEDRELLLVGAGDLVGASPAMSAMWADEPSIGALNLLGLRATSVGNHEFDQGRLELLRQQEGGCVSPRPDKACQYEPTYHGAKFSYLAANVLDSATGKPFMPAYRVETAHGIKIAFIGAVLKGTASVVLASGIAGLEFGDEADAVNRVLPELRAQGVGVFVVLLHQGGHSSEPFDQPDCSTLKGPIVDVVERLHPSISVVVSGHSHTGYTCRVDGRLVTQADMGGHMLSRIKLSVDPDSKRVLAASARNIVMTQGTYPEDPVMSEYLNAVRERSAAALARPVARLAVASVGREKSAAGETALGNLVADATLAAGQAAGAQIAFMNNGGLRKDLEAGADLVSTTGQTQMVLPFGNTLVVMTLTGAQIRALLEQQWGQDGADLHGVLQVSDGFQYRWDGRRPQGQRVLPGSVRLKGAPLDDAKPYRVVVNNFLAEGGDNFPVFAEGTQRVRTHIRDTDALADYLGKRDRAGNPAGSATPAGRIQRVQ
ncbi:bifunctional metallophosphatase/5'-nucleotidase [Janthinobacterium fluminis]|uniref:Bifunctional metallophosphatase/5'-nucleotidase n=1 Tax=Janthinobacterium fluminis TaxID=2987524 RepID=A0ABT5JX32_9BURK|nr:bifunctional metallophosphatase/5'-nucleotidase [Janthinobacterium fluminis]MDC8757124.1 bifunctional metallophosphatase/5'-nucleotidase [Janthinobacterium fluminis]